MFPTVAEVLELEPVRRGDPRVVAGHAGLAAPVRWVHVAEVTDIAHLLRGGEFLLITGVALPADEDGLRAYVADLAAVGVSALAVELGRRYTGELPKVMVEVAETAGLALVELHRETRFVEVTEAVHGRIIDARVGELAAAEDASRVFTELSLAGAAPLDVLRQLARLTGRPAVLENLAHLVLEYVPAAADPVELLRDWEHRSRRAAVPAGGSTGYDEWTGWLVTPVGARGEEWGRLVLALPGSPSSKERLLLERAATALALGRVAEPEALVRQSHRSLLAALHSRQATAEEVAVRARALGVPLDGRTLVGAALRLRGGNGVAVEEVAEGAAAVTGRAGLPALVGPVDDRTVGVLLALPRKAGAAEAEPALDRLAAGAGDAVVVGTGPAVVGPREARATLVEALQVAGAALVSTVRRSWYRMSDVGLAGLLSAQRDDPRLAAYVERELGVLLAHDARHGTDLVRTLRAYLEAGRNKSVAAQAAHLSRAAFYQRLATLERILGVDLDAPEPCLSLHVALTALQVLRG
ncbi:MAG: PucR family transcriptional regulator [Mycobacteriales bacterium]